VVSSHTYNSSKPDVVVMAITSQLRADSTMGEVWITEWRVAGLLRPSAIKPVFATLEQTIVIRQLGKLGESDQAALRKSIQQLLG
jgi:mRNA interferase MazF